MTRVARIAVALSLVVAGFFALYEFVDAPQSGWFGPALVRGHGRVVALTFDDGPNPARTPALLDLLERERVPATFFVVGRAVAAHPDLVRRMLHDGDELGNHTQLHAHLNVLPPAAIRREILAADAAIVAAGGRAPAWLRPPFGARNAATFEVARALGKRVVLWSAMPPDAEFPDAGRAAAIERWLEGAGDGPIVVLHDGDRGRDGSGGRSAEARDDTLAVIRSFRARGYRFVTMSQLVAGNAA